MTSGTAPTAIAARCLNINQSDMDTVIAEPSPADLLKKDSLQIRLCLIVCSAFFLSLSHNCKRDSVSLQIYFCLLILTYTVYRIVLGLKIKGAINPLCAFLESSLQFFMSLHLHYTEGVVRYSCPVFS